MPPGKPTQPRKKGRAMPSRRRPSATQAQQSASDAQHAADQASSNATEAKAALAVVESKSNDDDKRLSALQDLADVSALPATFGYAARVSSRTAWLTATVAVSAYDLGWKAS